METQKKYTLYIGLRDKKNKPLGKKRVIRLVSEKLQNVGIDGFTIIETVGYWKGEQEPAIKVTFVNTFGATDILMSGIARNLCKELNQECILVTKSIVEYALVKPL